MVTGMSQFTSGHPIRSVSLLTGRSLWLLLLQNKDKTLIPERNGYFYIAAVDQT